MGKFPFSTTPTPYLMIFWLRWLGFVQFYSRGKERTQRSNPSHSSLHRDPAKSSSGIVLSLTQDATSRDPHPRTQPRYEVGWAPTWWHFSAIQMLVSKHWHFNAVMGSQTHQGTHSGKSVRKVPKNLMPGSQQTAPVGELAEFECRFTSWKELRLPCQARTT